MEMENIVDCVTSGILPSSSKLTIIKSRKFKPCLFYAPRRNIHSYSAPRNQDDCETRTGCDDGIKLGVRRKGFRNVN